MNPLEWLLETDRWPRRWDCGDWEGGLGWSNIIANLSIALTYFAIPGFGLYFLRKKPDLLPSNALGYWCAAFVVACGLTHTMGAVVFWWPAYRLDATVRNATALVSLFACWEFVRVRKRILSYASPEEYLRQKMEIERQYEVMKAAHDRLEVEAKKLKEEVREVRHQRANAEQVRAIYARLDELAQTLPVPKPPSWRDETAQSSPITSRPQ